MILIDFTQTIIANLMMQLKMNKGEMSEDMLRHMILNSVRMYQKKYAPEYGELVLCTDAVSETNLKLPTNREVESREVYEA
mgnify:CR=1 FL=1